MRLGHEAQRLQLCRIHALWVSPCKRGKARLACWYNTKCDAFSFRVATSFSQDATPCFGRLLMDKRLHRFVNGFVLSHGPLHVHVSRFDVVGLPPPPPPPVFNVVLCFAFVFLFCLCLSLLVASWMCSPILNPEGRGEVRVFCVFFVAVPLVYFSGAIFCPSTVKMMCFFVRAHGFP